jgi:MATE family multidrug resistance protein
LAVRLPAHEHRGIGRNRSAPATSELRAIPLRGWIVVALAGAALIALQIPLATILLNAVGRRLGARGQTYFIIRIWSSPLALGNYVADG